MMKGYYFITDSALSRKENVSDVKAAVAAGACVVQYREKPAETLHLYKEALILRRLCRKTIFLINDRVDIALAVGADGVHLGSSDMPYKVARRLLGKDRIIGLTVHNFREALAAERLGADYIAVSPVFATATKKDAGRPCGCGLIRRIRGEISIPIVAIGGITLKNAAEVIEAGADCVCAISAVVAKPDVKAAAARFQELFKQGR